MPKIPAVILVLVVVVGALISAAGCGSSPSPPAVPDSRSNAPGTGRASLLLITVDTLRADHLPIYGYPLPTAPRTAALAARGAVFDSFLSPVPETGPAFASMLTGRWPVDLGVRGNNQRLGEGVPTAAESLRAAGYETAAFVSGYPLVRRVCGLDRGFEHYDDAMPDPRGRTPNVQRSAAKTTDAVLAWMARRGGSPRPLFLWLHYYDVHGDYDPGRPYDTMFRTGRSGPFIDPAEIPEYQRHHGPSGSAGATETDAASYIARYDGEIRRVDDQIGRLIDALGSSGELPRTLIVLTADHGESLTENGYYFDHGNELYLPSLHVPLILCGPGVPADGRRIAGSAQTPDLLPTLLDLLGVSPPPGVRGASLTRAFRDPGASEERGSGHDRPGASLPVRESFAEARFQPYRALTPGADTGPKVAARDDRFTVLLRLEARRMEIYDRRSDAHEEHDLAGESSGRTIDAALKENLERGFLARLEALRTGAEPVPPAIGPEARRGLEALAARR